MTITDQIASTEAASGSEPSLTELYERILLIRRFEERVVALFRRNKLPGFVHLYIGQEAVAVGACAPLRRDDYITSTHRGHGHVIAKGGDPSRMMAELYGRVTGYCKGKGGSMHITDMSLGMLGANGIVSGGLPIAVGAAYNAKLLKGSDQVVGAFFGDGATNEGPFHEAMNMAAAWKLPVVFVCENNYYGVSTRLDRVCPTTDLTIRAQGYAMTTTSVDGNDVLAVRDAMRDAVEACRRGEGPVFLECRTFRHRGHYEGENPHYWDPDERQSWLDRDPVSNTRSRLLASGERSEEQLTELEARVVARIDEAVAFAEASPMPDPADALQDVFAEGPAR